MHHASVTTMTTKSQGDWRTVHCYHMSKFYSQELVTLNSKWATPRIVTFHDDVWFYRPDTLWRTHACVRRHSTLTSEHWDKISVTNCECAANSSDKMGKITNMTSILVTADQSEFISGGPVSMRVFGSTTRVTRVTPTTWTSLPNTKNQRKCCPS